MIDINGSKEALKIAMELLKVSVKEEWDTEAFFTAMKMLTASQE